MNFKSAYLNQHHISELDPQKDYQEIYQLTAFYDFPRDDDAHLNFPRPAH